VSAKQRQPIGYSRDENGRRSVGSPYSVQFREHWFIPDSPLNPRQSL